MIMIIFCIAGGSRPSIDLRRHDLLQSIIIRVDKQPVVGYFKLFCTSGTPSNFYSTFRAVTQLNDIIPGRAVRAFDLLLCTAMADVQMCENQIRIPFIMTFNTLPDMPCQSHHHPEERM